MRVGIVGSGRIGGNAGRLFAGAGHEVLFSFSRDLGKLEALAREAGNGARAGTPGEAVEFGEVVMLSVPWALVDEALEAAGPLNGKVLIDTTNQFGPGGLATVTGGISAAEFNAGRVLGARLVKSYNTMTAGFQAEAAGRTGEDRVAMFYAGEDAEAKQVVAGLIEDSGFAPVDVGGWVGGGMDHGGPAPGRGGLRRGVHTRRGARNRRSFEEGRPRRGVEARPREQGGGINGQRAAREEGRRA